MAGRSPFSDFHASNEPPAHLAPYANNEAKDSYDDLIDEYAAPYGSNARHKTFNIEASSDFSHSRAPSFPLSHKQSHSVKFSIDNSQEHLNSGYPPPLSQDSTPASWWRRMWDLLPDSLACRLYVLMVMIETVIDIAIEGDLLVRVHDSTVNDTNDVGSRKMPVYLSIFVLAHLFQFVMALEAVYKRNTLQFLFLTGFNALFLAYAVIQIQEVKQNVALAANETSGNSGLSKIPIDVMTTVIPIVIGVSELAYIGLGWKIYNEFGWKVYKFLGADRRIKKMYANYQVYECLVKFDFFFFAAFSVQFIWLVLQANDWEYYVTLAALPFSLVLLFEGHLAARHENKWMMGAFMTGCVGAMVYFVYKLVKVLIYKSTLYSATWKSLLIFSVISIILLLLTFIYSVMLLHSFGRGLKDSLKKNTTQHKRQWSKHPQQTFTQNPNRMSID